MSGSNTLEFPRASFAVNGHAERRSKIAGMDTVALTIVHDLRNPLSAIHAAAEMLMSTELSKLQMQRLVKNMYLASMRSQELLQSFAESCRVESRRKACNLGELIAAAVARVSPTATIQTVLIEQLVPSDLITVADRSGIESVLDNLLNNAVQALTGGWGNPGVCFQDRWLGSCGGPGYGTRGSSGGPAEALSALCQRRKGEWSWTWAGVGLSHRHRTGRADVAKVRTRLGGCFAFTLPMESRAVMRE
jgi:His Kinase A (phospho-acceptor) domain